MLGQSAPLLVLITLLPAMVPYIYFTWSRAHLEQKTLTPVCVQIDELPQSVGSEYQLCATCFNSDSTIPQQFKLHFWQVISPLDDQRNHLKQIIASPAGKAEMLQCFDILHMLAYPTSSEFGQQVQFDNSSSSIKEILDLLNFTMTGPFNSKQLRIENQFRTLSVIQFLRSDKKAITHLLTVAYPHLGIVLWLLQITFYFIYGSALVCVSLFLYKWVMWAHLDFKLFLNIAVLWGLYLSLSINRFDQHNGYYNYSLMGYSCLALIKAGCPTAYIFTSFVFNILLYQFSSADPSAQLSWSLHIGMPVSTLLFLISHSLSKSLKNRELLAYFCPIWAVLVVLRLQAAVHDDFTSASSMIILIIMSLWAVEAIHKIKIVEFEVGNFEKVTQMEQQAEESIEEDF